MDLLGEYSAKEVQVNLSSKPGSFAVLHQNAYGLGLS